MIKTDHFQEISVRVPSFQLDTLIHRLKETMVFYQSSENRHNIKWLFID